MLYSVKDSNEYNSLAQKVIAHVEKSGWEDIKADLQGYETPSPLRMVNNDTLLTPDFSAMRNGNKYYFELVIKNDSIDQTTLISKWKALEMLARIKGGSLMLFVPRGSYKFADDLVKENNIEARMTRLSS